MATEIIEQPLTLDLYGFSGTAADKNYGGLAFKLSGQMWNEVKSLCIKNKGQNIWVYDNDHHVFAGVELDEAPPENSTLERKTIALPRYAYYKHVGPYSLIGQAGNNMQLAIRQKGLTSAMPYIEIYGHWTNDESKQETELISAIK